ncbi:MAG TPA: HEAT repeat domain-containing protein [Thermoanaerobaculia bacterium]|nr:HEAT repeat domain-containing protein [Thermoanaerobaculia bacterium]
MANEPSNPEKALMRTDAALPSPVGRSVLQRFGLGKEPSQLAPYLRAILAGLQEMSAEQIKQIPVLGPLLSGAGAALLQLSGEEDDAKLEEKISQIFTTGEQSRETLEALSALAAAIYLQQGVLLERLQAMGLPAERQQLTAVAMTTALTAWRGRVARDYQYADYRGIEGGTREEHAASLPLDTVYVVPRLVPERNQADTRDREGKLLKDLLDNQDLAPEERSKREEEFAVLTGERWRAGQKEGAGGRSVDHVLSQLRHAVVIGGPGVGKSTLTRFLARTCSLGREAMKERFGDRTGWDQDLTPIVLPLAGYTDARVRNKELSLRGYLDAILIRCGGEALRAALGQELQAGRVFLLLDGVDEIPDSRERILVVKAVDQFLADHAANRFLLTSRPYGYVRLAGDIPHFLLPNFSPEQVKTFIHQWQRAFERWRHPQAPDLAKAEKEAKEMLEEIQRNPKVFELASNPLMLVILALIRHEQARLPEERVQLYDRAVKTLMDTWNRGRSLAGIDVGGVQLPINNLVRVWGAVAEWTRRTKPTGIVHRAELTRKLVEILRDQELDEDNPEATAESYLNAAADRAGLLEERGKDIFAFWHPTFEEFLAAVELTTPSSRAIGRILPLRDDPRWREVILLAVGYLGIIQRDRDTATDLVEAIWCRDPGPLEPLLCSNLRLAAACIADDVGVKRSLAERVIVRLGEVCRELPYRPFTEAFIQTVRALPRLRPSRGTVTALKPLAEHDSWQVRMETVRLLSNVTSENPEALDICRLRLKDRDPDVQCHAALGLVRAGDDRPEVLASLAGFKSGLAHIEPFVQECFDSNREKWLRSLELLLTGPDAGLRWRAAQVLSSGGVDPAQWVPALEPLLMGSDAELRLRAAELLSSGGVDPVRWLPAMVPLLTDSNAELRLRAAELLSSGGVDPAQWVPALEPLLTSSDLGMRLRAAQVLNSGGVDPAQWVPALVPLLTDSDTDLHWRAAQLLRLGVDPAHWLPVLEPLLAGSATHQVLWEKVLQRQALTESDSDLLYELVRKKEGDKQNTVRELLFEGLYQGAERRPAA